MNHMNFVPPSLILMERGYTLIFTGKKAIFKMRAIGITALGKMNRTQPSASKRNGKLLHLISFPNDHQRRNLR